MFASISTAHLESVQVTALVGISYIKLSFVDTRLFPPQDMRNRLRGNPWNAVALKQTFLYLSSKLSYSCPPLTQGRSKRRNERYLRYASDIIQYP